MIATTTRLLTTSGPAVSAVSAVVSRSVYITALQQEFKIVGSKDPPPRRSVLWKLHGASSTLRSHRLEETENDAIPGPLDETTRRYLMEMEACDALKDMSRSAAATQPNEVSSNLREYLASAERTDDASNANGIAEADSCTASERRARRSSIGKQKYRAMRPWRQIGNATTSTNTDAHFVIKILSYNILAQNLLESHNNLYKKHNRGSLSWDKRMTLLHDEIMQAEANVICLQEVFVDHLEEFLSVFRKAGYDYVYKRRTNDKRDGLLLLYRADQLALHDHTMVELYRCNVDILNRDNVAIVAKFSLIDSPETRFVVATTHLLYNPRRNDVRLAQTQMLFAELERMAFLKFKKQDPRYLPIILSGDFNLQPYSGVYRFITEGEFEFRGRNRNLEPAMLCGLGNSLIPPSLLVTDNCQYYDVLVKRFRSENEDGLENSDKKRIAEELDTRTFAHQSVKIAEGQYANFSSGSLTHPFTLRSVYTHVNEAGEPEATTHQGEWVTVDYIFYSDVEPIERYDLPSANECLDLPTIPNSAVGSDHLCLGASFRLKKKKR